MATLSCALQERGRQRTWRSPIENVHRRDTPQVSNKLLYLTSGSLLFGSHQTIRSQNRLHAGTAHGLSSQPRPYVREADVPCRSHTSVEVSAGPQLFGQGMEQDVWTEGIGNQLQRENISKQDRLETSHSRTDLQEMDRDRAEVHSGNTATVSRAKHTHNVLERNRPSTDS